MMSLFTCKANNSMHTRIVQNMSVTLIWITLFCNKILIVSFKLNSWCILWLHWPFIYVYDTELKKLQLYLNLTSFIMVKGSISVSIFLQVITTALDLVHFHDTFLVWMFIPCLTKVFQILTKAKKGSVCIQNKNKTKPHSTRRSVPLCLHWNLRVWISQSRSTSRPSLIESSLALTFWGPLVLQTPEWQLYNNWSNFST